jgi:ferredoxin
VANAAAVPTVEFRSGGRLLVIGSSPEAVAAAASAGNDFDCHLLCEKGVEAPPGVTVHRREGEELKVSGHLGRFQVQLVSDQEARDLGAAVDPGRPVFDQLLDLGTRPAFEREWGPPGHVRPVEAGALGAAMQELRNMRGLVEKPKYFHLDSAACAHGLSGTEGCRRCIDACPADAISSESSRIVVDSHLCQGGGACATTCPTGAISSLAPTRDHSLRSLRALLSAFREEGDDACPVLVLHAESVTPAGLSAWPDSAVPWSFPELGSAGLELWFAALASGAAALRLLRPPDLASSVGRVLDEQVGVAQGILGAVGLPPGAMDWLPPAGDPLAGDRLPALPPLTGPLPASKPAVTGLALAHLQEHSGTAAKTRRLPAGATLGNVQVSDEACTTCLSCAHLCPTRALRGGGAELPQLLFTEADCVQCGLCRAACPENAIELEPRLLLPRAEARRQRVLHEDEPYPCVRCGKTFAPAATVNAIVEQLRDHPMFRGDAIEVLKCCDDCRLGAL